MLTSTDALVSQSEGRSSDDDSDPFVAAAIAVLDIVHRRLRRPYVDRLAEAQREADLLGPLDVSLTPDEIDEKLREMWGFVIAGQLDVIEYVDAKVRLRRPGGVLDKLAAARRALDELDAEHDQAKLRAANRISAR
jgi:hypothetical protein